MTEASVIISFFNKIHDLRLVLVSLENQSLRNFEVLIADDGSAEDVVTEIQRVIDHSPLNIRHIWHKDDGFRKTQILNKAVVASRSDYLIFIDGDCIVHSRFVEEHVRNKKINTALAGKRANLTKNISSRLNETKVKKRFLERFYTFYFIKGSLSRGLKNRRKHLKNGFYFKNRFFRKIFNKKKKGILGSNFSIHKEDLLAINGFDERYIHPSTGEDTDIRMRLENNGINIQSIKHMAVQYHLYHNVLERNPENLKILEDNKINNPVYTPYGIKKAYGNDSTH